MLTRRHVRRWLTLAGVAIGLLGIAGYIISLIGPPPFTRGDRVIDLGRGAISIHWVAGRSMPVDQVRLALDGTWSWLPWCDEQDNPFNQSWRSGRLVVPYWMLIVIGAAAAYRLLPAGYPRGRCQKCGYDLQGVRMESGSLKCPECGEPAA